VGIVGRTGAGKSSLVAALFRTADVVAGGGGDEAAWGGVVLDGLPAARVPLPRLRAALSLVSQDAAVFEGSVRRNLDLLGAHGDDALRAALASVGLAALGLDADVAAGGANLSGGERQLLCLARAFLRRARVVVLDEASASVDARTDAALQAAVKRSFAGATVITIAHRINTVLASDLVLDKDAGRVLEAGAPAELLADPGSAFAGLVRESARAGAGSAGAESAGAGDEKIAL
jgi:ABC-type multidrug transport system fused ATPase/permease subunit